MDTKVKNTLYNKLEKLKGESDLKDYVINYIVEYYKDDTEIIGFFDDISKSGCVSGMVGTLTYYTDTHKFYDEYYEDIEELRENLEEDLGTSIEVKGDLKNFYAWLAFEETAYKLAVELGIY